MWGENLRLAGLARHPSPPPQTLTLQSAEQEVTDTGPAGRSGAGTRRAPAWPSWRLAPGVQTPAEHSAEPHRFWSAATASQAPVSS